MTTLTETAYQTRKFINYAILAVVAYIILRIFWSIFSTVFIAIFPPKAAPPNHAFGKLPTLLFPTPAASPTSELSFQLETIEGSVPKASESATVYFMPKNPPNLLALTKATEFSRRLEFIKDPIQETKNIYRWEDSDAPLRIIRYDIVSKNFILRYQFEKDMGLFAERTVPVEQVAKSEAKNILQTYNLNQDDYENGASVVQYLKVVGDKLVKTTSLNQADSIRIDYFRAPIGNTPVVNAYPDEGLISFVFSGSKNTKKRVLQFAYTYWPIDYVTTATYGLKASSTAWSELQAGRGYIARYPAKGNTALVRTVYLGYYESIEPQTYMQPVFVFEGDDGFLAYVPAVAPPWIEEAK
jgi:hypothetical protein